MIVINPGTGPIKDCTVDRAYDNMRALLEVAQVVDATFGRDVDAEEDIPGYFSFLVRKPGAEDVPVDMPGVAIDVLTGSIISAPRLYVSGSSWWWDFAVGALQDAFDEAT